MHPHGMGPTSDNATIAGAVGAFISDDAGDAIWEVRVSPERLARILALCGEGRTLEVSTPGGSYRAVARRWWVQPVGAELLVRIALEESASA